MACLGNVFENNPNWKKFLKSVFGVFRRKKMHLGIEF